MFEFGFEFEFEFELEFGFEFEFEFELEFGFEFEFEFELEFGFEFGFRASGSRCWQQFVRVRGAEHQAAAKKPEHFPAGQPAAEKSSATSPELITQKKRTIVLFLLYYETFFLYGYMV
jgi:hypothetical protein